MGLKRARLLAGLSAREVAEKLGISSAAVYMWESGQTAPTSKRLTAVAKLYGCTVDELLKEDERVGK